MFENGISKKLAFYFLAALLTFSIILGSVFISFFRAEIIRRERVSLTNKTLAVADTISGYMTSRPSQGGMMALTNYLNLLGNVGEADIWLVDNSLNIYTTHNNSVSYKELPANANEIVTAAFDGQTIISEGFSAVIGKPVITVGTPIYANNYINGVLLMHASISDIDKVTKIGVKTMGAGLGVALLISIILSIWLSKSFTDPIIVKEAKEAMRLERLRRDYVANISHELKTPVTVLRGSLEALVDGVVTSKEDVESFHKEMLRETIYLQRLVLDLLDLSRLQNTDFPIEIEDVLLGEVLYDAVKSAKKLAEQKRVEITVREEQPNEQFQGDFGRLRQMFLIVLDNAIKFSPSEGKIDVVFEKNTISFTDYGCGIEAEKLPFIFERFYKSKNEQNKSGTGLGLAIASEIAARHKVCVKVDSEVDVYTRFTFTF